MKCLNARAKLTIQKLYEAMYDPKYMIEEGIYARIDNNPECLPVIIEKAGYLPGYGEVISIAQLENLHQKTVSDPRMEFIIVNGDYFPISFQNDLLGINKQVFSSERTIYLHLQHALKELADNWLKIIQTEQF